ncbi:phosphocholine-specific phospholipase C [Paraburkholderia sp. CNPSo 3076]|uniref:phosphocholine-specific phospholipase C n=1 Tax=Paraburkholderia sp. CNPSo 3076 TaxID=2940936 RepID=UPI002B1E31FD|nr:phospholipase C, phosphocholine-specific [Paraburkholderia sp. CNPSo 3076]
MEHMQISRRQFMRLAAAAAGTTVASTIFPGAIQRALATPANNGTGTINDVEHIVILMLENRSFDHYLGSLSGVRGFNDPSVTSDIWSQPDRNGGIVTPFHIDTDNTNFPIWKGLPHSWPDSQAANNGGRMNNWVLAKGGATMGYINRQDIPFHYALADAFTVCDAYHASMPGPTCPNRLYMLTGSNDPHGLGGFGPIIDNNNITQFTNGQGNMYGPGWVTYAESLQNAGISWGAYRQGTDKTSNDNSDGGMNVLLAFQNFVNALPGNPLYDRGVNPRTLAQFKQDVLANTLPQVSWLFAPRIFCEHPLWPPAYGVEWIARILDALTSNPDVWSKTAFIVTYDENDGFFDHVAPPRPAATSANGLSTVETSDEINPGDGNPFGLGNRVPTFVVSPWSRGGYVCSQTFDHTSLIRFIERRFGVHCGNITPWRRAVCGDLTSAFNFKTPNDVFPTSAPTISMSVSLPTNAVDFAAVTAANINKPVPTPPATPAGKPVVESGTRPARAIPYELFAKCAVTGGGPAVHFGNTGGVGVCYRVVDRLNLSNAPKYYTVEDSKTLDDFWTLTSGAYDLRVTGPNGFVREYVDTPSTSAALQVETCYGSDGSIRLSLINVGSGDVNATVSDNAYKMAPQTTRVPAGQTVELPIDLTASMSWYNFSITLKENSNFMCKVAGHVETGADSITDPAMAS